MKKITFIGFIILLSTVFSLAAQIGLASQAESASKNIAWERDINKALKAAKKADKLLILDFYADWCPPCQKMEKTTYVDNRVVTYLKNYIPVKIDIDQQQEIANRYDGNAKANGGSGIPATIILDPNGNQLAKAHGDLTSDELLALLKSAEAQRTR